jgi:gas vesicle protein
MSDDGNTYSVGIMAFLAGAVIGAGVALLMAPKSGAETRDLLRGYAARARDDMYERGRDAKDTLDAALGRGKEAYESMKGRGREAFAAGKEAMQAAQETTGNRGS